MVKKLEAYLHHYGVVKNNVALADRVAVNLKVFNRLQYNNRNMLTPVHTQTRSYTDAFIHRRVLSGTTQSKLWFERLPHEASKIDMITARQLNSCR
jgi:hypothetical protein